MDDAVIVTGSETLLGRKLIEKQLARGRRVVAPIIGKGPDRPDSGNDRLTVVSWNRSSWFSAKALVREARRRGSVLREAYLLHQGPSAAMNFRDTESGDIEETLESSLKGTLALARELQGIVEDNGGILCLVMPYRGSSPETPLSALSDGAFAGFAGSLLEELSETAWGAGFSSVSPDADTFADTILRYAGERHPKLRGRWLRFAEGKRPFGGIRIDRTPE